MIELMREMACNLVVREVWESGLENVSTKATSTTRTKTGSVKGCTGSRDDVRSFEEKEKEKGLLPSSFSRGVYGPGKVENCCSLK